MDSLAAKPSAAGPKASQDGSQADAAAPQAAAGAVETSSETADAGSGSAAEPIAAVPAEKGGTGGDSLDAAPAIDTLLSDSLDRVGGGMTPPIPWPPFLRWIRFFPTALRRRSKIASCGFFRAYSFQAGAESPGRQLESSIAGTGRQHSVREKGAGGSGPQGEAGADRQSTSGSATAKLDAAKQKEEALRRKNLERRAERMEKIWAKRRAKTGRRS